MMVKEKLSQIHMRDTFHPESAKNLTEEQNQDTLKSLIFLKVKRYEIVKGQTCADGCKNAKRRYPEMQLPPQCQRSPY